MNMNMNINKESKQLSTPSHAKSILTFCTKWHVMFVEGYNRNKYK